MNRDAHRPDASKAFSAWSKPVAITLPSAAVVIKCVLEFSGETAEGSIVAAPAIAWFQVLEIIRHDPEAIYRIGHREWEEIIAGAYERAGFDKVILTPRSRDRGRDVIAMREGAGSIRIVDQVKAYRPGHLVTADEVRSVMGVLLADPSASKAVVTTTSHFAPRLTEDDPGIAQLVPYRLELKGREQLLDWLEDLRQGPSS